MNALLSFLRSENRRTRGLFTLVALFLAAETGMVCYAFFASQIDWDLSSSAMEISLALSILPTALIIWLGYLRVRSWQAQSLRHFQRLFLSTDLLPVLFAPELPEHVERLLEHTRPPRMLKSSAPAHVSETSLLGRLRHFIRHYSAYEHAFIGVQLAAGSIGRRQPEAGDLRQSIFRRLRPLPQARNLLPIACTLSLLLLLGGILRGLPWLLLSIPFFYVALVWNTCRIEAQRIGLRTGLLEVFDPQAGVEAGSTYDETSAADLNRLPSELVENVKRRARPLTRSLRA